MIVLLRNFISIDVNPIHYYFSKVPNFAAISKNADSHYIIFLDFCELLEQSRSKKSLQFPAFEQILVVFVEYLSHFHRKSDSRDTEYDLLVVNIGQTVN